ncbi:multicopper oxidase family protein [Catenuloplanes atrovinosus]|uniref:FtsP/CotA-like multicopper oxidase with cupredoxin domain n=1 Tax=Catenuloplanes atrovinosus TaxID=137266 RepID=A0AAE3YND0_9ACTN|nr:multicopper oxidase family protein [Catenuloplanes atrovinosus]MDR7276994.1 FtsP/CotA-like multicopper oxidase with cupredoxin domain [Catenuloplanes atrovinosus]
MYGILIFVDLTLAVVALAVAPVYGFRPGRTWARVVAAVVASRLAVAVALMTGSVLLADSRLTVQVPLAVLPVAWALWRPGRTAAHVATAGVLLSVWWLLVPFGPRDVTAVLAGSVAVLVLVAALSVPLTRRRAAGSRPAALPWLATVALLVPAVTLVVAERANAAAEGAHRHAGGQQSVDRLTGPRDRAADVRFTLTAARGAITLASGRTVEGITVNGAAPGPQLRARKGQLVEVTLVNTDVAEGVTLHWHGVDVPNAEDGVPGVTQDAVPPGQRHVYRFVPTRAGTYWYHTHRDGSRNVAKGLFGALIIDEAAPVAALERTLFTHVWPGTEGAALDVADRPARQDAAPGTTVLLRLVNSSEDRQTIRVGGVPFRVAALDGNAIQGATELRAGTGLPLAAGGRYDVAFTMPAEAVIVAVDGSPDATLTLALPGARDPVAPAGGALFDPLAYGSGADRPDGAYQRTFDLRLDDGFGFSQGRFSYVSSLINGRLYPAVPTLDVSLGDRVRVRIASRSVADHPFHLHGHRIRVLSRNGVPVSGSPWWTDTLNVGTGEAYEVEFVADNPGIWMDHCHNFSHGANGMIMHLAYAGVSSPYSSDHSPE